VVTADAEVAGLHLEAILLDFVQTTRPMPVDEQRWRSRLRAGLQSSAAL
jgi:hypothetical protein